jgi:hypothetical protein
LRKGSLIDGIHKTLSGEREMFKRVLRTIIRRTSLYMNTISVPTNAQWYFDVGFIAGYAPTCFSHICGRLQGGTNYENIRTIVPPKINIFSDGMVLKII